MVDNDMKTHNMAKMSNQCPIASEKECNALSKDQKNECPFSASANNDNVTYNDSLVKKLNNKKDIEVSIQSNHDKVKENLLRKLIINSFKL